MPIRPEERAKYPADWPAISARIRVRAGNRCEQCGVPNYAVGWRDASGAFNRAGGNGPQDFAGQGLRWPSGEPLTFAEALEFKDVNNEGGSADSEGRRWIVIVLTVAHLNHDPADCREENLRALCQRCHNRLDVVSRRAGIVERRRALNGDLFEGVS
jgi:hypothetical protein